MSFRLDSSDLEKGMEEFSKKMDVAILLLAKTGAAQMENYAKENRVWTDRSNRARQSLKGSVQKRNGYNRIMISHGVEYGIWLELANEGKYQVLKPTLNAVGPKIIAAYEGLFTRG